MSENNGTLNALIQEQIDKDTEFQSSLADLSDEDKSAKITEKREALIEAEFQKGRKSQELAENYKVRAEKAEKGLKDSSSVKSPEGLSERDLLAVVKANVPEEDLDDVKDYASLKKISIADALKSDFVKGILSHKAEVRKTAQATQTRSTRSVSKPTGDEIVADISARGEDAIPARGSEEAEALFMKRARGRGAKV